MNYALQLPAALREIGTRVRQRNIGEAKNRDLAHRVHKPQFLKGEI